MPTDLKRMSTPFKERTQDSMMEELRKVNYINTSQVAKPPKHKYDPKKSLETNSNQANPTQP